jgi:hypothetical protein
MNRLIATLSIALTLVAWPAFSQTPRTTLAGHSESSGAAAPEATTSQHAVRVRVSPHNSFAPGYVEAVIQIEPDARNRRLRVEVDSGAYYRGTNVQLDGDTAARSHLQEERPSARRVHRRRQCAAGKSHADRDARAIRRAGDLIKARGQGSNRPTSRPGGSRPSRCPCSGSPGVRYRRPVPESAWRSTGAGRPWHHQQSRRSQSVRS